MGSTKEKLLRILEILKKTDEEHPVTTAKIIEQLNEGGLEPERKSVLRDIRLLKDHGYNIEYAPDNKDGFYLAEREFEDWELKVLVDAVQSAGFLNREDTDKLVGKLCALASEAAGEAMKYMAIPSSSKIGDKSVKNSIDMIMHAIKDHRKVLFDYVYTDCSGRTVPKHPDGTKPISPYTLIWRGDNYYLIGSYSNSVGLSYYRLDRIRNICELPDEKAVPIRDILGDDYIRKLRTFVTQNIYNKKGQTVRLRLALFRNGINELRDTFGNDAVIISNPDGTVDAYVTVSSSEGLIEWLMKHSSDFMVLEPASVKSKLIERAKAMLKHYDQFEKESKSLDELAFEFASKYHAGQFNDDPHEPVICHPIAVAALVDGEKEKAVAYLHDVLEDTEATEEELRALFGDEIADAVAADTRQPGEDYWEYLERVKQNPLALKVKLADLTHNLSRETDRSSKRYAKHLRAYEELKELI